MSGRLVGSFKSKRRTTSGKIQGTPGFEPGTSRSAVECSTTELYPLTTKHDFYGYLPLAALFRVGRVQSIDFRFDELPRINMNMISNNNHLEPAPISTHLRMLSRDRIVVSTLRCGRNNPGSNPGHGTF